MTFKTVAEFAQPKRDRLAQDLTNGDPSLAREGAHVGAGHVDVEFRAGGAGGKVVNGGEVVCVTVRVAKPESRLVRVSRQTSDTVDHLEERVQLELLSFLDGFLGSGAEKDRSKLMILRAAFRQPGLTQSDIVQSLCTLSRFWKRLQTISTRRKSWKLRCSKMVVQSSSGSETGRTGSGSAFRAS